MIPLPYSEALVTDHPSLHELLDQPWTYGRGLEVPGLYLLSPTVFGAYEEVEEFRCHLSDNGELGPGLAAYYRTWRTIDETAHNEDYQRAVYVRTV